MFTKFGRSQLISGGDREIDVLDYTGVRKFVHTSNCHGQNCTRRAMFRLGIETL